MKKLLVFSALGLAIVLTGCSLGTPKAEQNQTQPTPANDQGATQTTPVQNQTVTETPSATPKTVAATPAPTPKPVAAAAVDCGTTAPNIITGNSSTYITDPALVCFSEKISDSCKSAKVIVKENGISATFITNGQNGGKCLIRYFDASNPSIYRECPISVGSYMTMNGKSLSVDDLNNSGLSISWVGLNIVIDMMKGMPTCYGTFPKK